MRVKAAQALCWINVGLLVVGQPLLANEPSTNAKAAKATTKSSTTLTADQKFQIRTEEQFLRDYEKEQGSHIPDFPERIANLARVYAKNGQIDQAEKTISRALESAKTFRNPDYIVQGIMSNYAFEMAFHDKTKARKAIAVGLESANRLPFGSNERLGYLLNMIAFYKQIGAQEEANKQIADLDEQLRALERANGLDANIIESVAYTLAQMSGLFCLPNKQGIGDFKKAEAYQLRSIAQFDKLQNDRRLMAHVRLQEWYQSFGMKKQSDEQANIVKSLNNGKPFVKQACHGCGLG